MRLRSAPIVLFVMFVCSCVGAQRTIWAKPGDGRGGNGTAETPYTSLQRAVRMAREGERVVALPGVYRERVRFRGKNIVVTSRDGAAVTVLDAGGAGPAVRIDRRLTSRTVLSGFTIRNGVGTPHGGGLQVVNASPTIRDCIITSNRARHGDDGDRLGAAGRDGFHGGAVWVHHHARPHFERCHFQRNGAGRGGDGGPGNDFDPTIHPGRGGHGGHGGAVFVDRYCGASFTRCFFVENHAGRGGMSPPTPLLGLENRGGHGGSGGALYLAPVANVDLVLCAFVRNAAGDGLDLEADGGDGGAIVVGPSATCSLDRCELWHNRAGDGGTGSDGAHGGDGGGIRARGRTTLNGSLLVGNRAGHGGDGWRDHGGLGGNGGSGGALYGQLVVNGCTVAANARGGRGDGLFLGRTGDGDGIASSAARVVNSVFWNSERNEVGGGPRFSHSCVRGIGGPGVIDDDPRFVDPARGNYRLRAGSPLIDQGDVEAAEEMGVLDLTGRARVNGGAIDIGAYERQPLLYPGTGDGLLLATGVGGPPTHGPGEDTKRLRRGQKLEIHVTARDRELHGKPVLLLAQVIATGKVPSQPVRKLHLGGVDAPMILVGSFDEEGSVTLERDGKWFTFQAAFPDAPDLVGLSLVIQAAVLDEEAPNGMGVFSEGHEILLTP